MSVELARVVIFWITAASFLISLRANGYRTQAGFGLMGVALMTTWWRLLWIQ